MNGHYLLAYLRTSATFLFVGIALIKFFDSVITQIAGFMFLFGSMVVGVYGVIKYDAMRQLIIGERNVRHAKDISENHDSAMINVPKVMWDMVHRAYQRFTLHEKSE